VAQRRVAVAASGGRDSTALLHCTVRAGAALGVEVVALHVHHGLNAQADAWSRQVRLQAQRWGAAFDSHQLSVEPAAGESVEAWARRERYRALAGMARDAGCGLVLLAHHRRDQAETWLLQALRGGGPRGLASMPALAHRQGLGWARPWLDLPREAIEAYVRRHRLRHVDDGSNADPRFARNALRLSVWPALLAAFPQAESALVAAAHQAQHAAALADEVALLDLPAVTAACALVQAPWQALPSARRRNALRAWLATQVPGAVPDSLLQRLCDELPACRAARWPAPGGQLRLYRGLLAFAPEAGAAGASPQTPAACALIDLSRPGQVSLPAWAGQFDVLPVTEGGAAPHHLHTLQVAARRGGERFRLSARSTPRSLKKQFQARAIPPWEREGPLLYTPRGELLFVPGLGIDAALQAAPGEPQLLLRWQPGLRQPGG
jgi:tRNA(Ile)-lysidine synthase